MYIPQKMIPLFFNLTELKPVQKSCIILCHICFFFL